MGDDLPLKPMKTAEMDDEIEIKLVKSDMMDEMPIGGNKTGAYMLDEMPIKSMKPNAFD